MLKLNQFIKCCALIGKSNKSNASDWSTVKAVVSPGELIQFSNIPERGLLERGLIRGRVFFTQINGKDIYMIGCQF